MAAPFAALEARSAVAVVKHLANVDLPEFGLGVQAIFDNGHELGNVGMLNMASTQPTLLCRSVDIPAGEPVGLQITVAGTLYAVIAGEPDGTGMTRLILERAA